MDGEMDFDTEAIVELPDTQESKTQTNTNQLNKSIIEIERKTEYKYQKRGSTSGIKGQLYETKLITLIRIRSFIEEYEQFYLGTSLEGIGALDDICVRYKQNNKDFIVFLQAKHRNEITKGKVTANDLWKPAGDFSLLRYFKSYLKIRERFNKSKKCDVMFHGKYKDLKCYLVIYTSTGNDLKNKVTPKDRPADNSVRNLIQSGEYSGIFQYQYADVEVDLLTKSVLVEEMKCLGKNLFNYTNRNFETMLRDHYIRKYHVVLARCVINVSDVNNAGYRTGTFRDDFFNNNDVLLVAFKEELFYEAVKRIKLNKQYFEELVQAVVLEPTAGTVSKLIQSVPIYYNYQTNTLTIEDESIKDIADALCEVKIRYNVYEEACDMAVKEKLNSICFKLPATFGNIDMVVKDGEKGTRRLQYLADKLEKVMSLFKDKNVIVNDELFGPNKMIDAGVMDLNGGLGSAVGNLLIPSEEDMYLKFNVDYETLGKNAKLLLVLLKNKISDLDTYKLKLDVEGYPKLSLKADARDRILAIDFFNNLWFYTNQAKEHDVESLGKEILENYCITTKYASERSATSTRYDAIYFKIHDEVQKWWISEGESFYLTNDRKLFDDILKEFLENSLLTILSSIYVKHMKTYDIEFDKISVQSLWTKFESVYTIVITDVITLIGIKLVQHIQTLTHTNDYAFIELDSPLLYSKNDRNILKEEIKNKKLKILIIIYDDISESKNELLQYIIRETPSKQIVIVMNTITYEKLLSYNIDNRKFRMVSDDRIEFSDLVPTSQRKVLRSNLIFQGTEIAFETIIEKDTKYLIAPRILQKILNNDKIEVGRTISNPKYEEIKYYYVDRQLSIKTGSRKELFSHVMTTTTTKVNAPELNMKTQIIKLKSLEDINNTVVLIGAPGIGKSIYLTHISIKTKEQNPTIWIERINLLDYTKEFHRWQKNKIKIDHIEALKFVCKSALTKITSRKNINYNFDEIVFDLEILNGVLVLRDYEGRNDFFELEMFIYCYNKGKTVLLFDGFDEICPHYKDEITDLLKCLVTRSSAVNLADRSYHNRQRMWIASRSYNSIIVTLKSHFGVTYDLEALTEPELKIYINKYLKLNLNLKELNYDQFMNIDGFFEFMIQHDDLWPDKKVNKQFKHSTFLLNLLYFTAVEYFVSETKYIPLTYEKYSLVEKWRSINKYNKNVIGISRVNAFYQTELKLLTKEKCREALIKKHTVTPLHMYFALDYFTNEIKNTALRITKDVSKWNLEANTSSFYKHFLESNLKSIRFEQKNQMDLYNPDIKLTYEKELKEFLDKHKKIAFYATFIAELNEILTKVEIDEMQKIIKEFEAAEEKTGVVAYIINGVPKFIHLTLQEYLTTEYITDLLRTKPQEDQTKLWKFIIKNIRDAVLEFFDCKLECDDELKNIFLSNEIKEAIFNKAIEHNPLHRIESQGERISIMEQAITKDLRHTTRLILRAMVDVVNKNNLDDFITFLNNHKIFNKVVYRRWDKITNLILDCIRRIDPSKLCDIELNLFETTRRDFASLSNKGIITLLRIDLNRSYDDNRSTFHTKMNIDNGRPWQSL